MKPPETKWTEEDNPYKVSSEYHKMEETQEYKYGWNKGYVASERFHLLLIAIMVANLLGLVYMCGLIVANC